MAAYPAEPFNVLAEIVSVLNHISAPYFIGGSFASGALGDFRATNDIDIVCDFSRVDLARFIALAKENFFSDELLIPKAVAAGGHFNLLHKESMFKFDFFTKIGAFEASELKRALELQVFNLPAPLRLASAEDTILAKLRWYQKGGGVSERQWRDIMGVIKIKRDQLDLEYLQHWAKELGVQDLLGKLV